jgi:hypothetical protein
MFMLSQYYIFVWCYTMDMLAFNHLLAGAVVAMVVPAPFVPVVALGTHYLLDMTPHAYGEEPPYTRRLIIQLIVDAIISIGVIIFLLLFFPADKWFIVFTGAFFGFLPDVLWLFINKGPEWFQKFLTFSNWIQWGERTYGWIFETFYGFVFVFSLFALNGRL